MGRKRVEPKQQLNVRLTTQLVGRIREEAARLRKQPNFIVEFRLAHSFRVSPKKFPHKPDTAA